VLRSTLTIRPEPEYIDQRTVFFSNHIAMFMVQQPYNKLTMTAESEVETSPPDNPLPETTPFWEGIADLLRLHTATEELDAYQFVYPSPMIPVIPESVDYATQGRPVLEAAAELTDRIFRQFTYDKSG